MSKREILAATLSGSVFAQGLAGGANLGPTLNAQSQQATSKVKTMQLEDDVLIVNMTNGSELLIPLTMVTVMRAAAPPKASTQKTDLSLTKESK